MFMLSGPSRETAPLMALADEPSCAEARGRSKAGRVTPASTSPATVHEARTVPVQVVTGFSPALICVPVGRSRGLSGGDPARTNRNQARASFVCSLSHLLKHVDIGVEPRQIGLTVHTTLDGQSVQPPLE